MSNDYYPALAQICGSDQPRYQLADQAASPTAPAPPDADVIIYGTAFKATDFLTPMTTMAVMEPI